MGNPSEGKNLKDYRCIFCKEILIGDEILKRCCQECEQESVSKAIDSSDMISYLEIARICFACIPEEIIEELDIDDDEFLRLRDQLHEVMNEN